MWQVKLLWSFPTVKAHGEPIQSLLLRKHLRTWAQYFHLYRYEDYLAVWECLEKAFEEGRIKLEFQF